MKTVLIGVALLLILINTQANQTFEDEDYFCAEDEWAEGCIPRETSEETSATRPAETAFEAEPNAESAPHSESLPLSEVEEPPETTRPAENSAPSEEPLFEPVHPIVNRPEYVTLREPLEETVATQPQSSITTDNTDDTEIGQPQAEVQEQVLQVDEDCAPATYHNDSRQAYLPYVDIPLYTDIDGQQLMWLGIYSAVLEITDGFADFAVKTLSFQSVSTQSHPCHAQFEPITGLLEIPQLEIPTLAIMASGHWAQGPRVTCQATLQQSVIRIEMLSLNTLACQLMEVVF